MIVKSHPEGYIQSVLFHIFNLSAVLDADVVRGEFLVMLDCEKYHGGGHLQLSFSFCINRQRSLVHFGAKMH